MGNLIPFSILFFFFFFCVFSLQSSRFEETSSSSPLLRFPPPPPVAACDYKLRLPGYVGLPPKVRSNELVFILYEIQSCPGLDGSSSSAVSLTCIDIPLFQSSLYT